MRIGPSRQFFSGDRNNILDRVPHPFYDPETLSNDFMIMKLATRVENVQPVRLESSMTDEERDLKVMGFGATFEGGFGSFFLQEVGVRQISHPTCNEKYDGDILKESMLCAGQDGGGQDSVRFFVVCSIRWCVCLFSRVLTVLPSGPGYSVKEIAVARW